MHDAFVVSLTCTVANIAANRFYFDG